LSSDRADLSERAMATLHWATAAGFRDPTLTLAGSDLDPLRSRSDFRPLVMDLAMLADPFVRGD
jgi:hypothetical protein